MFDQSNTDKIALVDMDGTLVDYMGQMVKDLNLLRSPFEAEFTVETMSDLPKWLENRMDLIKKVPGWWRSLKKLEDGFLVLEWAVKFGFKPQILTKGPRRTTIAWDEKCVWCQQNIDTLPYIKQPIDITVTHDKSGVYGTVLVEDWPPYINGWLKQRKNGIVILLDRPYNKNYSHPQVVRFIDNNPESINTMLSTLKHAYVNG